MPLPRASTQPLRSFGIGLLVAMAGVGCHKQEVVPTGDVLATLAAQPLDGKEFNAQSFKGKPSLLMFVSPTCPHCLDEIPRADKVAKEQNANAIAVFIVGRQEDAEAVIAKAKFGGTALIDDGSLKSRYGIKAVPYTLVLGADGYAKSAYRGAQDEDTLADAVKSAR
jgi:thiol-disulfide isomerase/thioredoxin